MKRPLLVAAVLAAAPLMAGTAKAETKPLQMFNVNAPAAGVMTFSGTGTANYNQSLGTNNSLNLGSSTNVGVTASASSTQDYESAGYAELNLDATSRMQQTIGTATTAFNASTAAESASRAADTTAFSAANSYPKNFIMRLVIVLWISPSWKISFWGLLFVIPYWWPFT